MSATAPLSAPEIYIEPEWPVNYAGTTLQDANARNREVSIPPCTFAQPYERLFFDLWKIACIRQEGTEIL
jgi:hypothetical protein